MLACEFDVGHRGQHRSAIQQEQAAKAAFPKAPGDLVLGIRAALDRLI